MIPIFSRFLTNLGIDLGTANTIIFADKKGYIINQPSVVAMDMDDRLVACGSDAKRMMGKTGKTINVIRPLSDGVIANFEAGEEMVKAFIKNASVSRFKIGRVIIGVPTGVTGVEKQAVIESAETAGAREVFLIAEPMAAAIGSGVDVLANRAQMIVDIGGGTTDIAVINYGGIVADNTIRVAGDEMNDAIRRHLKNRYHLVIGEASAEQLKMDFASIDPEDDFRSIEVKGIDYVSGLPRRLRLPGFFLREALNDVINSIVAAVIGIFERLPLDLVDDVVDNGIILTGGGALLKGLDRIITEKSQLNVKIAENALFSVAEGTRTALEKFTTFQKVFLRHYRN